MTQAGLHLPKSADELSNNNNTDINMNSLIATNFFCKAR